jgi:hypothetical protein
MRNLSWPTAVVVVAFLAAITALGLTGNDTAALVAVGLAILSGLGIVAGQTNAVRENTNGNASRMLDIMERDRRETLALAHRLASMTPMPSTLEHVPAADDVSIPAVVTVDARDWDMKVRGE